MSRDSALSRRSRIEGPSTTNRCDLELRAAYREAPIRYNFPWNGTRGRLLQLHIATLIAAVFCTLAAEAAVAPARVAQASVALTAVPDGVRVEIGGRLFTQYRHARLPRPILYPVIGPSGAAMTRDYPMSSGRKGESHDHIHHRSLWFAHGAVNGEDFWGESDRSGRIQETSFRIVAPDVLESTNEWRSRKDDRVVCTDTRRMRFQVWPEGWFIDCEIVLHASEGDLLLGDTKEGSMAIRLNDALRLKGEGAHGQARNSQGVTGAEVWGKRADWVDYWGPLDGKLVGVACFDHPASFRHPTWWHARDYGLVAANPFGLHDFGAGEAGAGDARVPKGQSLRLRYGFLFHAGTPDEAHVAEAYRRWAETP